MKFLIKFKLNFKSFEKSNRTLKKRYYFETFRELPSSPCNDTVINFFLVGYTLFTRKESCVFHDYIVETNKETLISRDTWNMRGPVFLREFMLIPIPDGEPRFYRNINLSVYQPLCKMLSFKG